MVLATILHRLGKAEKISSGGWKNNRQFYGRRATLRPTCCAVARGTSPSTVTRWSPMGREKNVVVPSSEEASSVRSGGELASTNTETLASPSLRTICETGC